ncbi:hypothetical protein HK096_008536 [Nowakowskiella sp. JEL0078]|nr:hypothetical protein HK096_008536 [Nowakowskiella sp. JEL0078]
MATMTAALAALGHQIAPPWEEFNQRLYERFLEELDWSDNEEFDDEPEFDTDSDDGSDVVSSNGNLSDADTAVDENPDPIAQEPPAPEAEVGEVIDPVEADDEGGAAPIYEVDGIRYLDPFQLDMVEEDSPDGWIRYLRRTGRWHRIPRDVRNHLQTVYGPRIRTLIGLAHIRPPTHDWGQTGCPHWYHTQLFHDSLRNGLPKEL